jgi:predicted fused transcriptional regulator/phosphomethylpyrimidine kinase
LIVAVAPEAVNTVYDVCNQIGVTSNVVGTVEAGTGVYIDNMLVSSMDRIAIDWAYGSFKDQDETLKDLREAISQLEGLEGFSSLIPQVGSNMVYAKKNAENPENVAALTGKFIKMKESTYACGQVEYGGSRYTCSIVLEAVRIDPRIRSAIRVRGGGDIAGSLLSQGINVKELEIVETGDVCPVTTDITESGVLFGAYHHLGAFGVEPTTTILAETPLKLVGIIRKVIRDINNR